MRDCPNVIEETSKLETRGMITLDFASMYSRYCAYIIAAFSLIVHGFKDGIRKMYLKRNREIKILDDYIRAH
jgi:hypothetical protein